MSHSRTPIVLFAAFWLSGLILIVGTYVSNPHDPALTGTEAYGHTQPGELSHILAITAGEMLVFLVLLRPWSYHRSWLRAVGALLVLTPWLLLWGVLGLHAGPTTHTHTLLLGLLWFGLAVTSVVSGVAVIRMRRRVQPPAI
jgi:hypothetical protein